MNIAQDTGIRGPCCIQMKESSEGQLELIEINSRLGGGTIFSALAGANFPKMILDLLEGTEVKIPKISEITVVRYYEEIVIQESQQDKNSLAFSEPNLLSETGRPE
jgi:carbamoyl-phosphate synthase large subunit